MKSRLLPLIPQIFLFLVESTQAVRITDTAYARIKRTSNEHLRTWTIWRLSQVWFFRRQELLKARHVHKAQDVVDVAAENPDVLQHIVV